MILEVESLNKSYAANVALNNFCMNVEEGNVLGILGPNGSGKTTLLSILTGLRKANSGNFRWFGGNNNKLYNNRIGAIVETPCFYPYLSVYNNLLLTATEKNIPSSCIETVIDKVDLQRKRNSKCNTLSFGMKQRLAIAQSIIGNPQVLVLDEPTNGLDPIGIADIRNIIKCQSEDGKTIIIASHNLDEIQKICSHVVILKNGKNIANGRVDELLKLKHIATIETTQTTEAECIINKISDIKIIEHTNLSITISASSNDDINATIAALSHSNIGIAKFEIRKPSLEELFIDIVKNN